MATLTKTLKLPFLRLNQTKKEEFFRLEKLNTEVANQVLSMPKEERLSLTSKAFQHVEIGSAWTCTTIRTVNQSKKAKHFRRMPLSVSNQGYAIHQIGNTFSISFSLIRGIKKRIPLDIHPSAHKEILLGILNGTVKAGSLKLVHSRKGIWYVCISVSMEVPDTPETTHWMGIDRGQNLPAVAATPDGPVIFFKAARIHHTRRIYAARRKKLQKLGKHRAIKKLANREHRIITHINHCMSKKLVALARSQQAGIRLENLQGIRKASQAKKSKQDAGQNRDYWPTYQLEQFLTYKAQFAGIRIEKINPAYTSKTCHQCGAINDRKKHLYSCKRCGYRAHADANAAMNIRDWYELCYPLELKVPLDGLYEPALNSVQKANPSGFVD